MALQTIVKVSGINNLTDARYCAGMGVEMLGFGIDQEATDFIGFQKIEEIIQWLSGVQLVGEIGTQNITTVQEYGFDFLEIGNLTELQQLSVLATNNSNTIANAIPKIILKIKLTADNLQEIGHILEKYHTQVSYFLVESAMNLDTNLAVVLKNYCQKYPILLAFGITKENILQILASIKPAGIVLYGGNEISAGLKDMDNLAEILEMIEI